MRKLLHATLLLCACGHYARVGAVRGRAKQVFVNGTQVLRDGEHTNAKPGRW